MKTNVKQSISIIALVIVAGACFKWVDLPLAIWFHNQTWVGFSRFCSKLGHILATSHWLALAILFLFTGIFAKFMQLVRYQKALLYIGSSYIFAFIITLIIKFILARYRPIAFFEHSHYGFHFLSMKHQFNSMPSGHAMSAFSMLSAIGFALKKRPLTILLLLIAALIALSRLVAQAHYLSDIVVGGYIGLAVSLWAHGLFFGRLFPNTNK